MLGCPRRPPDPTPFENALAIVTLTAVERSVIEERYVKLLKEMESRAYRIAVLFHSARVTITVGSIIVPAMLSIQLPTVGTASANSDPIHAYWVTWIISLFVTICNGLLTLFKLDKKYFMLHTTLEQMRSEGWQFLELSGRYSGYYTPGRNPTHQNQFRFFTTAVEKLKMRQVEEEYFKLTDTHKDTPSKSGAQQHTAPTTQQAAGSQAAAAPTHERVPTIGHATVVPLSVVDSMIPPTPLKEVLIHQVGLSDQDVNAILTMISNTRAERATVGDAAAGSNTTQTPANPQSAPSTTSSATQGQADSGQGAAQAPV